MITFKQFLGEDSAPVDAREFFLREAKPFIDKSEGGGLLVRGTDHKPPTLARIKLPSGREVDVGITAVRKDRRPMDVPSDVHSKTDDWMNETFGIRGRSQTAFVFGEHRASDAKSYGELYAVIPQGDFKFLWSPKVTDMFDYYQYKGFGERVRGLHGADKDTAIELELLNMEYTDTDLRRAIKSGNEIMIECQHLLLVNLRDGDTELMEELKEVLS